MFSKFSENAQKILLLSKDEMNKLKHPYIGSEHLVLAILSNKDFAVTKKLNTLNINYDSFRDELIKIIGIGKTANNWFLYTPLLKRIIENAIYDSREKGEKAVSVERLFMSLLEEGDGVAIRIFISMDIDIDKLYDIFSNRLNIKKSKKDKKLLVNDFSVNFNKKVLADEVDPVVCRDKEVKRLIEILSRRCKNNPLLIGEAGVGKTAIVEELARRIENGDVPKFLQNKKILSISISSMVAGTKYRGEFEERINKILKEVESAKNIIMFIDEIHTIVGAGGAEGAIDASNILKPALARGKIRIIGATTNIEYRNSIEKDKALDRRFQKINVLEPDKDSTMTILTSLKPIYSKYHNVKLNENILSYIIHLADKYITCGQNPDKSIDILDEVCAHASLIVSNKEKKIMDLSKELKNIKKSKNEAVIKGDFQLASELKKEEEQLKEKLNLYSISNTKQRKIVINKKMVDEVVGLKTKIPICEINQNKDVVINKLQKNLLKNIVGQEKVIDNLCKYTKIIRSPLAKNRPYSFLLIGKTGVGKTMLVKYYANYLYGKENFFRLDMSEFKEEHSISKIIGSPPGYVGYDDNNYLLEKVRKNPYSVLLLDEIEKAHPSVIKLFLQVLDEGVMHDSSGRLISFKNTIIFMTSNLGTNQNSVGFSNIKDKSIIKEFFSVEFLNRIDRIYELADLDFNCIKKIVSKKIRNIKSKYREKSIDIVISTNIVDKIIKESNYQEYGARKVDKIIEDLITTQIIDNLINGDEIIKV